MRNWWRIGFLGLTALVVTAELVAAFDRNPETDPWTDLIVAYVPEEVTYALIGALLLWLPYHLWRRYRRRDRKEAS